jgi:Tol biopolymer transport system component
MADEQAFRRDIVAGSWRVILAVLLATLGLAAIGAPAASAAPSQGLIVFDSDRGGHTDLWTMRFDGSGLAQLTNDKVPDIFPEWSPNGKKIAWARGDSGAEEIWVMNADGSGRRQITNNAFSDIDPVWSPDSTQIAFRSIRDGNPDIYVINVDGTSERRLTNTPGIDNAPDWSPDGTRIVFSSERSGAFAVWTMSAADGSDARQLTPDSLQAGIPRYSPTGSQIAFVDQRCTTCTVQSDVWVMNADGSGARRVTSTPENETTEAWSRDGTRTLADFARLIDHSLAKSDVAIVNMATGAVTNLTNTTNSNDGHADWQP